MSNVEDFNNDGYCYVENAVSKDICDIATQYCLLDEKFYYHLEGRGHEQVKNSHSRYSDLLMESLLLYVQPIIEQNTGKNVFPTYSYYRVYRKENVLDPHTDREACEISASLCLGFNYPDDYEGWPLYVDDTPFYMEQGDIAIYKGEEINHYRYPFYVGENNYQVQVFLHYVDADGKHSSWKNDRREGGIGSSPSTKK